jgi:hypothetical protein
LRITAFSGINTFITMRSRPVRGTRDGVATVDVQRHTSRDLKSDAQALIKNIAVMTELAEIEGHDIYLNASFEGP